MTSVRVCGGSFILARGWWANGLSCSRRRTQAGRATFARPRPTPRTHRRHSASGVDRLTHCRRAKVELLGRRARRLQRGANVREAARGQLALADVERREARAALAAHPQAERACVKGKGKSGWRMCM